MPPLPLNLPPPTLERLSFTTAPGVTLACRACGPVDAPRLLFLHGFPEASFVWEAVMAGFGQRWRCLAPDLRGYGESSAPADVAAYRAKHLVADLAALVAQTGSGPLHALIAHDWGGALAWNMAAQRPELLQRLVIINSPHPALFLRELARNPAQQAASAYMNDLAAPDAEAVYAANDFARLFELLTHQGGSEAWLDEAERARYREVWSRGLTGALNYYRASPLRPPTAGDPGAAAVQLPPELVTVRVPTLVIWGEVDTALPPSLLDGLEAYVPELRIERVPGGTHWLLHEQPERVARLIETGLG
ncbi:alpha/beta fold hydrolase [Roseateles sp. NT4]|uniref:alpha/beta fold hydrolase n=1 Tax=Roseateles sp. NT4 TaxID=3453715 RepID=UPI003EEDADF4